MELGCGVLQEQRREYAGGMYCVRDPELRRRLERYSRAQQLVTLHYQNDLVMWRWECNGGYSIIIEVLPEEPLREQAEVP